MNNVTSLLRQSPIGGPPSPPDPASARHSEQARTAMDTLRMWAQHCIALIALAAGHRRSKGPGVLIIDVSSQSANDLPSTGAAILSATEFVSLSDALRRSERPNRRVARLMSVRERPHGNPYILFGPLCTRLIGRFLDPISTPTTLLEGQQIEPARPSGPIEPLFGDDEGSLYILDGSAQHEPPASPADYEEVLVTGGWHRTAVILARHKRSLCWAACPNSMRPGATRGVTIGPVIESEEPGWATFDVTTTQTVAAHIRRPGLTDRRTISALALDPHEELNDGFGAPFSSLRIDLGRLWPMAN